MDMLATTFEGVVDTLVGIANPLVGLLVGLAVVYFVYGVVVFISASGDETKVEEGKKTIGWGLLAIFIMVSVWGLVGVVASSLDLTDKGVVNKGFAK